MSAHPLPGPSFSSPEIPELAALRIAIDWAKARRIRVAPAAPPVECISSHAPLRWVRRDGDATIDPIGAAILSKQPPVSNLVDAAAIALETCVAVAEGLADGLAGDKPSPSWMTSPARHRYGPAYLAGIQLRVELSTWQCSFHGLRMPLGEPCGTCVRVLL